MTCDACPAHAVGTLTFPPSQQSLDLCGHHMRGATTALDARGGEYEAVYRTVTV
jgi:hypothetical protein